MGVQARAGHAWSIEREGAVTDSNEMDPENPFTQDVRSAVLEHMNEDHREDSLAIVRCFGGRADATSAWMTGVDGSGGDFAVEGPLGIDAVRVPWARPISQRHEIRAELARLVGEARGT